MQEELVKVRFRGLTDLDRLELEKAVGAENVKVDRQTTGEGRLGDPTGGALTAVVTIAIASLPVISATLGMWLAHGSRRSHLRDEIEFETADLRVKRKLVISSHESSEIKAEVVKQLSELASLARKSDSEQ